MIKRILIALLAVPVIAAAGSPRKKAAGKKAADPAPATTTTTSPTSPTTPTTTTATTPVSATPQAAGASSTPGAAPQAPATPPAGAGSAAPPPTDDKAKDAKDARDARDAAKDSAKDADAAAGDAKDVDALRQEYLALRDELFKSRARANAVAGQLYSTRMTIRFTWGSARYYGVTKASIRLDGATVFEDATGAIAGDDGVRFDGYVAPGRHLVTFHVEASGKDDDSFTSATESQIVVKAIAQKDLVVAAKGHDNGDISYAWKKDEHGSYAIGIDVGVKTTATGKAAK